jgi:acyl dehydratase
MIDPKFIGYEPPPHSVTVEKSQLAFFARAIGEENPVYFDDKAAAAVVGQSVMMPPTFAFSLYNMERDPFNFLNTLDVDLENLLHGEQSFENLAPVYAGDTITFRSRVENIYSKKDGALGSVDSRDSA